MNVANRKVEQVAGGQYDYDGLQFAGKDLLITCRHSFLEPNEVYSFKVGKEPVKLSSVTDPIMNTLGDVKCEKMMIPTTNGKMMTTWVLLPPNFDPNKKYPSLLFCEGGRSISCKPILELSLEPPHHGRKRLCGVRS